MDIPARNVLADQLIYQVQSVRQTGPTSVVKGFLYYGELAITLFTTQSYRKLPVFCSSIPGPRLPWKIPFTSPWDTWISLPFQMSV